VALKPVDTFGTGPVISVSLVSIAGSRAIVPPRAATAAERAASIEPIPADWLAMNGLQAPSTCPPAEVSAAGAGAVATSAASAPAMMAAASGPRRCCS
jgi:hypothetical protein